MANLQLTGRRIIERRGDLLICRNAHKKMEIIKIIDKSEVEDYWKKGWKVAEDNGLYIAMMPEVPLADISEPWKNPSAHPEDIWNWWNFLKSNRAWIEEEFDVIFLDGWMSEIEIRIAVESPKVRKKIFSLYKGKKRKWANIRFIKTTKLAQASDKVKAIVEEYEKRDVPKERYYNEIFYSTVPANFWKEDNRNFTIFIPISGVKFACSYAHQYGWDKVLFLEVHVLPDHCDVMVYDELAGKKVVIIDKVYSGETMKMAIDIVKEHKGRVEEVVALYPKSKLGLLISGADSFYFATQKFSVKDIPDGKDWGWKLLWEVWRNEIHCD